MVQIHSAECEKLPLLVILFKIYLRENVKSWVVCTPTSYLNLMTMFEGNSVDENVSHKYHLCSARDPKNASQKRNRLMMNMRSSCYLPPQSLNHSHLSADPPIAVCFSMRYLLSYYHPKRRIVLELMYEQTIWLCRQFALDQANRFEFEEMPRWLVLTTTLLETRRLVYEQNGSKN